MKGRPLILRGEIVVLIASSGQVGTRSSSVVLLWYLLVIPGMRRHVAASLLRRVGRWLLRFLAWRHLDVQPATLRLIITILLLVRTQSLVLQVLLHGGTWRQLMHAFEVASELLCQSLTLLL